MSPTRCPLPPPPFAPTQMIEWLSTGAKIASNVIWNPFNWPLNLTLFPTDHWQDRMCVFFKLQLVHFLNIWPSLLFVKFSAYHSPWYCLRRQELFSWWCASLKIYAGIYSFWDFDNLCHYIYLGLFLPFSYLCWLIYQSIDTDWCWLMLIDIDWPWLILIDADW